MNAFDGLCLASPKQSPMLVVGYPGLCLASSKQSPILVVDYPRHSEGRQRMQVCHSLCLCLKCLFYAITDIITRISTKWKHFHFLFFVVI